jgi:uncharacterized protein
MEVDFDGAKRDKTLAERGLDFADAGKVFDGVHLSGQNTDKSTPKTDSSQ